MAFDREIFFDLVRKSPFGGTLIQSQVDGIEYILAVWEESYDDWDTRWLAYSLATTFHETAATMQPVEEYGKGEGQPYGVPDPETGQTYYGRGFVQLTWRDNYARADRELELPKAMSLEYHAHYACDPEMAAAVMFQGMAAGWFRSGEDFAKYFSTTVDDPFGAREIINGDKTIVPDWSHGKSIGELIKGYHLDFLAALEEAQVSREVVVTVRAPPGVRVRVQIEDPDDE